MEFEWDQAKDRANQAKHGIAFAEAKTVFNDPFALTIFDPDHSEHEDRWIDVGLSNLGRVVVVWYTERGGVIRIIGCRQATRRERWEYENERTE